MRKGRLLVGFLMLAILQPEAVASHPSTEIEYYLTLFAKTESIKKISGERIIKLAVNLQEKKASRTEDEYLRLIFLKTHQRFLKKYSPYATFDEMMTRGVYNCLSGTALYAMLLSYLGYQYQIIETNYHIFLIVEGDEGRYLFEATDAYSGFVSETEGFEKRMNFYKENKLQNTSSISSYYHYQFKLFNEISLDELGGLFHFNRAIVAFNANNLGESIAELSKATELYNSPRVEALLKVLCLSVTQTNPGSFERTNYLKKIQAIRERRTPVSGPFTNNG